MSAQREPTRSRGLFLGLLFGVSILLIGGLLLFVINLVNNPSASASNGPIPYTLNLRFSPTTTNIRDLFPQTLGPFTRKSVDGDLSGSEPTRFSATYANGKNTITLKGSREANNEQAKFDFTHTADGVFSTDRTSGQDHGFYYVMATVEGGAVRLVYVRTFWMFDLTASSRTTLDDFMKVFKY